MTHRGPDDAGYCWESGVGLGMRRLSIVDIAGGHQPMANDDGSVWIVFNGEIYNAPELRRALAAQGCVFRTRSDTEVVLRLFERAGLRFADEMRGMWALAIHDRRTKRVLLSRDRLGIKPLFLLEGGSETLFASELRAFRAVPGELRPGALEIDACAAQAMLSWSYIPGAATIYRGVRSVDPGTHEILTTEGAGQRQRYWTLRRNEQAAAVSSMNEAAELTEETLRRAIREHLESDVPVGAFLSGGIDSGLVASYAADVAPSISTFTAGSDLPAFDESLHAATVARAIGSKHVLRRLGAADVFGSLVDVLVASDGPFGDSSLVAAWSVSRLAAQTHKVVLAGDGGDEIFAGYVKHSIIEWRRRLQSFPSGPFRRIEGLLGRLPQSREHRATDFFRKARRAVSALGVSPAKAYAGLTRIASLDDAASLLLRPSYESPFHTLVETTFASGPGDDELSKTLATDISVVLPNDMLAKVDQASMLNSLEARVPMLDHRLVELGWSLPGRFKLSSRGGKLVLRELFARRFPASLAWRRKQGFQVPVESWLAGPLVPALDWAFAPQRLQRHGLFDRRRFDAPGRRELLMHRPLLLWNAFCLAVWCEASVGSVDTGELRDILSGRKRAAGASGPPRPASSPVSTAT
jgi:asparagine synthase (glutamine-hydrolysing)